jgi:hypothetical protein
MPQRIGDRAYLVTANALLYRIREVAVPRLTLLGAATWQPHRCNGSISTPFRGEPQIAALQTRTSAEFVKNTPRGNLENEECSTPRK